MDEIHFYCVICGENLIAAPENAGGFCSCPRCLRVIPVPGFPSRPGESAVSAEAFPADILGIEMKFFCSHCASKIQVDARRRRQTLECPVCHEPMLVPDWSGAVPPFSAGEKVLPPGPAVRISAEEREFLTTPLNPREITPRAIVAG